LESDGPVDKLQGLFSSVQKIGNLQSFLPTDTLGHQFLQNATAQDKTKTYANAYISPF
jgi:hypothetical protein